MKEVRIEEDVNRGGIIVNLLCCDHGFCVNGKSVNGQINFFPTEEEPSITFCCPRCKKSGEISYSDGVYEIIIPGLKISYVLGELICVSGKCHCQNNCLKDDFTKKTCDEHCVRSCKEGVYTFSCPCNRTHVLIVRKDHFHVCSHGECPVLSKQS